MTPERGTTRTQDDAGRYVAAVPLTGWATVRVAGYLLAALAGVVLTAVQNARFSAEQGGFDVAEYVRQAFANPAAASFGTDLLVTVLAGLVFMAVEGRRLRIRATVPLMVTAFLLAFAFAFPCFLALREVRLARAGGD